MKARQTRTFHPVSLGLLALCLLAEFEVVRQYGSVRSALEVYAALGVGASGLIRIIASLGPLLPALLIVLGAALIAKELWIRDARRTIAINAVTAPLLLILPFLMLSCVLAAVQGVIRQLGS